MPLYSLAIYCRNFLYAVGLLSSKKTPIKSICVGNLSVGGTGKTPMVEYITELLRNSYHISILSRGYRRKTTGFLKVNASHKAVDVGDEPMQYFEKFGNVSVCVGEDRYEAMLKMRNECPDTDVVILDDAYQHRQVKAGLNILLTDFYHPYFEDHLLPVGNLREHRCETKRADIIVVTKSPKILSPIIREGMLHEMNLKSHQRGLFAYIHHGDLTYLNGEKVTFNNNKIYFLMLVGIVNPYPLEEYLRRFTDDVEVFKYPDHHYFTEKELLKIKQHFLNYFSNQKFIVTTEKDYMRLKNTPEFEILKDLPICYVPIETRFHENDKQIFDQIILDYARQN